MSQLPDKPARSDENPAATSASAAADPRGSLSRFAGREASAPEEEDAEEEALSSRPRLRVADGEALRPFMRGILVHSLLDRGLAFEDAYEVAQEAAHRLRGRSEVGREELRSLVEELTEAAARQGAGSPALSFDAVVEVLGKDGRRPFNQGRLQQSLLAAALRPSRAFEIVLEIERDLREGGEAKVSRDALRDRVAALLRDRVSASTADRYLGWRSFQAEDERPLILLLGGTTGVGKSTLALEVARRFSIGRLLSTDSIRDVMRVMLSDDLVPTLHVSSFEAHTRLVNPPRDGTDAVIEGFLEQSRTVSVGVRAVIERAIAEGTSIVLDGVSLVPGLFDPLEWRDRAHVFFLLVADEDRESLQGHLVARAHGRGARASERYVRNFQGIFTIQEDLLERAQHHAVPVVDVQDLDGAARTVVKHVVDRLVERRRAEAGA
ncbi:MAG: ATP cone domain-containing protein [Myxococcota bacterium]